MLEYLLGRQQPPLTVEPLNGGTARSNDTGIRCVNTVSKTAGMAGARSN